jgi:hypothetical protein
MDGWMDGWMDGCDYYDVCDVARALIVYERRRRRREGADFYIACCKCTFFERILFIAAGTFL